MRKGPFSEPPRGFGALAHRRPARVKVLVLEAAHAGHHDVVNVLEAAAALFDHLRLKGFQGKLEAEFIGEALAILPFEVLGAGKNI